MNKGLILTMGLSPDPLIFSINNTKADFVVFIGTKDSLKESVDITVEKTGLRPSQYNKIEIPDDSSKIDLLCEKFQEAKNWLENQGSDNIIADPTGGRKWMSAGATMAASFLGVPMMYIDAKYSKGILDEESMTAVKLGNAYDQTGFVLAAKGRDAYNMNDFEGASNQFANIKPTYAHKKAMFFGLAELCKNLGRWDRFEHYGKGISNDISKSIELIEGAISYGAGHEEFKNFTMQIKSFNDSLNSIESFKQLNLAFITDVFLNARRCISRGRYDDAVGRHYRTLESISQFLLKRDFHIDCDKPNYSLLSIEQLKEFESACRDNKAPSKIDLKLGFWLLKVLNHPIKDFVFKGTQMYNTFILEGILSDRNASILAHGFQPIGLTKAQNFDEKLDSLLENVFGEEFKKIKNELVLPKMPLLGF